MEFAKPALTLDAQIALLVARGMTGDRALMKARLESVSYYRLSGYWFPFRKTDDQFRDNTSFESVWERYVFDRALRLVVMDAVERIEIAVRAFAQRSRTTTR
jgi:abortive infection bacteriophage resistance protein